MISIKSIREFSDDSDEGKMLLAAISILTSIKSDDIVGNRFGGSVHPDDALRSIVDIANKVYYEEEWKMEQSRIKRDNKIDEIIN